MSEPVLVWCCGRQATPPPGSWKLGKKGLCYGRRTEGWVSEQMNSQRTVSV